MSTTNSKSTFSETVKTWISPVKEREVPPPTNSVGTTSNNPYQKQIVISGAYSGSISVPYDTDAEATRRANLKANGITAPSPKTDGVKL